MSAVIDLAEIDRRLASIYAAAKRGACLAAIDAFRALLLAMSLNQRSQVRAGELAHDRSVREDLFKEFIAAASKVYGNAVLSSEPQVQELVALYAMISTMRLLSSPRVFACAVKVMRATVETYFAPNKTIRELDELVRSGMDVDPLKDFSEAVRNELRTFSATRLHVSRPTLSNQRGRRVARRRLAL
jgi:hypothetical protein